MQQKTKTATITTQNKHKSTNIFLWFIVFLKQKVQKTTQIHNMKKIQNISQKHNNIHTKKQFKLKQHTKYTPRTTTRTTDTTKSRKYAK